MLAIGAVIGVVLPKAKTNLLDRKGGGKNPKKIAIMIVDQIDPFDYKKANSIRALFKFW